MSSTIRSSSVLEEIIDRLDGLNLIDVNSDIKGDAFEYFLRQYNSGYKDLGEYFTPRHFIKFIVKLLNPKFGEKVYDPFCGTGGMLIESFKHISSKVTQSDKDTMSFLKNNTIYGNEITETARVAKMNMILMGDGHNNIERKDSLEYPVAEKYDVVITNIPFSQKTDHLNKYDIKKGGGDSACFQHCIQSLKRGDSSRAGIIMPLSFLYKDSLKDVREHIYRKYKLEFHSIFSFPVKAFAPYTDSRAAILFIKGIDKVPKDIWYFNIKDDGYTLNNKREKRKESGDLDRILAEQIQEVDCLPIPYHKVKENNYNLMDAEYLSFNFNSHKYKSCSLSDLIEEVEEYKVDTTCDIYSVTNEAGLVRSIDMFSEQVYSKDTSGYKLVRPRWFVYSPARVNVGSLNINMTEVVGAVSPSYVTFRIKDESVIAWQYLYAILKTPKVKTFISKLCYGTVRQSLSFKNFIRISIPLPSKQEQLILAKHYIEKENIRHNINCEIQEVVECMEHTLTK